MSGVTSPPRTPRTHPRAPAAARTAPLAFVSRATPATMPFAPAPRALANPARPVASRVASGTSAAHARTCATLGRRAVGTFGGNARAIARAPARVSRGAPGPRRGAATITAMGRRVDPSDKWWTKHEAANMRECGGMDDFLACVAEAGDRLVVVDFYARWCGACRALAPKLAKIAEANPDVIVLKVEFDDNKDMCRSMGVKVLPFFQLYRGAEGKVASFSASLSKSHKLADAVAEHDLLGNARRAKEAASGDREKSRDEMPTSR